MVLKNNVEHFGQTTKAPRANLKTCICEFMVFIRVFHIGYKPSIHTVAVVVAISAQVLKVSDMVPTSSFWLLANMPCGIRGEMEGVLRGLN